MPPTDRPLEGVFVWSSHLQDSALADSLRGSAWRRPPDPAPTASGLQGARGTEAWTAPGRVWVPGRGERTAQPCRGVLVAVQPQNGTGEGRGGRAKSAASGTPPGRSSREGTWKYLGTTRPPGPRTPCGRSAPIYPPERDSERWGVQFSGDVLPDHPVGRAALCLWSGNWRHLERFLPRYPVAAPVGPAGVQAPTGAGPPAPAAYSLARESGNGNPLRSLHV